MCTCCLHLAEYLLYIFHFHVSKWTCCVCVYLKVNEWLWYVELAVMFILVVNWIIRCRMSASRQRKWIMLTHTKFIGWFSSSLAFFCLHAIYINHWQNHMLFSLNTHIHTQTCAQYIEIHHTHLLYSMNIYSEMSIQHTKNLCSNLNNSKFWLNFHTNLLLLISSFIFTFHFGPLF